ASLLQVTNAANSGNINMERITQPMYRYDFTYWHSPVNQSSGFTLGNLSPLTLSDKYFSWTPSVGGASGIWIAETSASVMDHRKGYIVRAPQTYSTNPAVKVPYTGNFIGVPNNGNIVCPIGYGSMGPTATDDKWNLLGNPYPSAVSAASFLNDPANAAAIDGTIYLWTHNTPWSTAWPDPFYANYVINYTSADYASWNKTGGVGTIASSGGPAPNGYIAAGEAFFVKSLGVPGTATFKNSMRVADNNSQFFKINPSIVNEQVMERHRIWLNFTNESGSFNQLLVGYVTGATLGWDRGIDGTRLSTSDVTFYSIIPEDKLVIQGRPLPFQNNDVVPLGYTSLSTGNFTIRLDHVDGLFVNQAIYLEDKYLNVIHDLKQNPYEFLTEAGIFDDRFVLRYSNLAFETISEAKIDASALIKEETLNVQASKGIVQITIYDLTGKLIHEYKPQELSSFFKAPFLHANGAYLAKIEMENGSLCMKKIIN
ncbi:MAG TPA: T9SS type A sorting domain-containing protein, partial [Flavobacterium sp.]